MAAGSGSVPIDDDYSSRLDEDVTSISSGRTIATTVTKYRHEHGRTYHAFRDGEYWQPNDERQQNHEAIVHHLCLMTLRDRLYLAPIGDDPKHILDLGTGTGIWATDMADKFPSAQVIGTDLYPAPPGMQPPNVSFEIDDAASEWIYPDNHFDFIHIRGMFGSISDWPWLYQQSLQHLRPGGWIEQLEYSVHCKSIERDGRVGPDHVLARWGENANECSRRMGKPFDVAETMARKIEEAGFVDVTEKVFKWPIGPWSSDPRLKELGRWNLLNWEEGMEGWVMAIYTRSLGWSYEQVQTYLKEVQVAMRNRRDHVYHELRVVYARKPEQGTPAAAP